MSGASTPKPKQKSETKKSLETAIAEVIAEIKNVDAQILRLNNRRLGLTAKFDRLNEKQLMNDSEAIAAEQNWEIGKFILK